mgnify:CR=1 FL=1
MRKFVGRRVQVECAGEPPEPIIVSEGERRWEIVAIEQAWFDTGHGSTPVRARTWRTRRHRKNYLLRASSGERLLVYYDYAQAEKKTWHLVSVEEDAP